MKIPTAPIQSTRVCNQHLPSPGVWVEFDAERIAIVSII